MLIITFSFLSILISSDARADVLTSDSQTVTSSSAETQTTAMISTSCGPECESAQAANLNAITKSQCHMLIKHLQCEKILGKDKNIRNCETENFDAPENPTSRIMGCLTGYYSFFKDIALSPIQLIQSSWEQTTHDARYFDRNVYRACKERESRYLTEKNVATKKNHHEHLIQCKRRLLDEFSDLNTKHAKDGYRASYDDIRADVHGRLREIEKEKMSLEKYIRDNPDFFKSLHRDAIEILNKQKIKYQCYNDKRAAELFCYGYLTVLGAAVGAQKTIAHLRTTAMSATDDFDAARSIRANEFGRRPEDRMDQLNRRGAQHPVIVGRDPQNLESLTLPSVRPLPKSMILGSDDKGQNHFVYTTRLSDGRVVRDSKEIQIDPLTGLIDGAYSSGRTFIEKLSQSKAGKAHLAFIDVGSLRYVSEHFGDGYAAGDRYLKSVVDKILANSQGKVTLVRTGGDEFTLLIDEADPQKVKALLKRIQTEIRKDHDADAKKVFREEKARRVAAYKNATGAEKERLLKEIEELAHYQQPDISIGSTQYGYNDDFKSALARADAQAKEMKIATALKFGRSAEKYQSNEPPSPKVKPTFIADVKDPAPSPSWVQSDVDNASQYVDNASGSAVTNNTSVVDLSDGSSDLEALPAMRHTREVEMKRIKRTLARYRDETGSPTYQIEDYYTDPVTQQRQFTTLEIPVRNNSGLPDGVHPTSQQFIDEVRLARPQAVLTMPKLRSLSYTNYYESGTDAGDRMLASVARALQKSTRKNDILFQLRGNEYLWVFDQMSPNALKKIQERVVKDVVNDPEVKSLIATEKATLSRKLAEARTQNDSASIAYYEKALNDEARFKIDLQFQTVTSQEAPATVPLSQVVRTLQNKFPPR